MKTQLPKAVLGNHGVNLNKEGRSALFVARAGLKRVKRREISYELQYSPHEMLPAKRVYAKDSYDFWWNIPHNEPFSGDDHELLKEELTRIICDDFTLMKIITGDIKEWALSKAGRGGHLYYNMSEFREVYDYRYSVSARLANTELLLEISYV